MTKNIRPVRILLVEDSADDAELVQLALRRSDVKLDCVHVPDGEGAMLAFAEGDIDFVLTDFSLPDMEATRLIVDIKKQDPIFPIIVVSGAVGEEAAADLMRAGASDLVLKHNLARLVPAIERELRMAEQTHARRESDKRFKDIVLTTADWIWETDKTHKLCFDIGGREQPEWADPLRRIGYTHWEALGVNIEQDENWRAYRDVLDSHEPFRNFRFCFVTPTGQEYHISMNGVPHFDRQGAFLGYRGTATDETIVVENYLRAERAEAQLNGPLKTGS